ncbi:hypothetical protein PsAD14_05711 [Pseudovibrio sp. Ad14]|nr:hypothetical protein PsW74_05451 [Pseudovibrio sp. W74]KZL03181.1 hypothetical protein PsAD14_05711 [Pseudovibrio sp. Ad14]
MIGFMLKAGMWPVRRSLASRKPRTNMSELVCEIDVGSADPAEILQARSRSTDTHSSRAHEVLNEQLFSIDFYARQLTLS